MNLNSITVETSFHFSSVDRQPALDYFHLLNVDTDNDIKVLYLIIILFFLLQSILIYMILLIIFHLDFKVLNTHQYTMEVNQIVGNI